MTTYQTFDEFLGAQAGAVNNSPDAIDRRPVDILEPLRLRYFSPAELLPLFHFTPPCVPSTTQQIIEKSGHFTWPPGVSQKTKYKLMGNSVNVEVVRRLIDYLFEGDAWKTDMYIKASKAH